MGVQLGHGGIRFPGLEQADEALVRRGRAWHVAMGRVRDAEKGRDETSDRIPRGKQTLTTRHDDNLAVELDVWLGNPIEVVQPHGVDHLVGVRLEKNNTGRIGAPGRPANRVGLDEEAQVVDVVDVVWCNADDERATARLEAHQPFVGETGQRLANGDAADAEFLGESGLFEMQPGL